MHICTIAYSVVTKYAFCNCTSNVAQPSLARVPTQLCRRLWDENEEKEGKKEDKTEKRKQGRRTRRNKKGRGRKREKRVEKEEDKKMEEKKEEKKGGAMYQARAVRIIEDAYLQMTLSHFLAV